MRSNFVSEVLHILVVDDDRAGAELLRRMMKNLRARYELHFVWDGVEALEFLHRRGNYENAPQPRLILLDINMPRLGGLETLAAIKGDPELCVIPVIMLSTSDAPEDVRDSYQFRANGFIQKPINLEQSVKLFKAIESFWLNFAVLPDRKERFIRKNGRAFEDSPHSGLLIATESAEAKSRAMFDPSPDTLLIKSGCKEHNRLLDVFGKAVHEVLHLHEQQFLAIVEGDDECSRFDLLIHMANEQKQLAKYAYLRHVEAHGCSKI